MMQSSDAAGGREWNPYELATPIVRAAATRTAVGINALMIFRADRRCLHDMVADTIVVEAR